MPVQPEWLPQDFADARAAWEGPMAGREGLRVRVEAAAYNGLPVSFAVVGPWTRPSLMNPVPTDPIDYAVRVFVYTLVILVVASAAVLARRNLRTKRADVRGAWRLAAAVAVLELLAWAVGGHHLSGFAAEIETFVRALEPVALLAVVLWAFYVALEPSVRRFWPDSLLGWSRLLAGHLYDPRVGRDVLAGMLVGMLAALVEIAKVIVLPALGFTAPYPMYARAPLLDGGGIVAATWALSATSGICVALLVVLVVVLLRTIVRLTWLTALISWLLLALYTTQGVGDTTNLVLLVPAIAATALTWLLFHGGLLPFAIALLVRALLLAMPAVGDLSHWASSSANWTLAGLAGLTAYAFYASRAGQPFLASLLDD